MSACIDPAREEFLVAGGIPSIVLKGIRLHAVTMDQVLKLIRQRIAEQAGGWVVTPNLDILRQAQGDDWLRDIINTADLALADGMPLVWASRLQGTPLPQRVAGSALVWSLAEECARNGWRLFLLGGAPGVADRAAQKFIEKYNRIMIAGSYCPSFGFEADPKQIQAIRDTLAQAKPDVIYVGLGCPKQERLIESLRYICPSAWWLGIGISLSFISGDVQRAPRWLQVVGMEWLYRLIQEPRRLIRRYVVDGIPFAARLLWASWCKRA